MTGLLRPWRDGGRLWRALVHVILSVPIGGLTFALVVTLGVVAAGLLITFLLALPVIWLLFTGGHVLAGIERTRLAALLDVELADAVRPPTRPTWFGRLGERLRSKARWRELAYLFLLLPLGLVTGGVAGIAWCGSAALLALPAYVAALPGDGQAVAVRGRAGRAGDRRRRDRRGGHRAGRPVGRAGDGRCARRGRAPAARAGLAGRAGGPGDAPGDQPPDHGDIEVTDAFASVEAVSEHGDVKAVNVTGPRAWRRGTAT